MATMRAMTWVAAALVACATLAIAVYSNAATGHLVRTHFFISFRVEETAQPGSFRVEILGRIRASSGKCVRERRVKLFFEREGKRHLRDSGLSSQRGAIGLTGRAHSPPHRYIVKVTRKRIDTPRHHYTCTRAAKVFKPHSF
jgi:hypothetical protein